METEATSRRRRAPRSDVERDARGFRLCRNCRTRVPRGRFSYCSDMCAAQYLIKASPEAAALAYRQEFGTRCRSCGKDEIECMELYERAVNLLRGTPCESLLLPFRLWQLDHIRPVADGGGECGLDNMRLLCPSCHGDVTVNWRTQRAQRKNATGPWAASARGRAAYKVPLSILDEETRDG